MGLSMFVLSKVGQIGVPPNPQAKTMLYFMPAFMTLLFLRFASGLNLYYAVSNIFSIPQQYMIAQRRLREQGETQRETGNGEREAGKGQGSCCPIPLSPSLRLPARPRSRRSRPRRRA